MEPTRNDASRAITAQRLRSALFTVAIATALALGFYSLVLAHIQAGQASSARLTGLLRTAAPVDAEKIGTAIGARAGHDLAYVVLDVADGGPDPAAEVAVRGAARSLAESGTDCDVRLLGPGDPDFRTIAAQNGITRFPAVLAVRRGGGIVLVTDVIDQEHLLEAYREVRVRASSCVEAADDVY